VHDREHDVTRGINQAVAGVEARLAVHVCFGNLYGRPFSAVRDDWPAHLELGAGVIDVKAFKSETAEE